VRPDANPEEVAKLNKEIEELLVQVEASGNTGEVDKAQELMVKVEMLKTEKERLLQKQPTIAGFDTGDDFHEKMEVCQDCGCFLVINDTPQRIQSHLEGKQHMGYVRIRSTIEELKVSVCVCVFVSLCAHLCII
jgi:Icc-related predicted phosphoesterase